MGGSDHPKLSHNCYESEEGMEIDEPDFSSALAHVEERFEGGFKEKQVGHSCAAIQSSVLCARAHARPNFQPQ